MWHNVIREGVIILELENFQKVNPTLRQLRIDSGLKAYKVAEKLDISRKQLFRIENGQVKDMSNYASGMAEIYSVTVSEIKKAWEDANNGRGSS